MVNGVYKNGEYNVTMRSPGSFYSAFCTPTYNAFILYPLHESEDQYTYDLGINNQPFIALLIYQRI